MCASACMAGPCRKPPISCPHIWVDPCRWLFESKSYDACSGNHCSKDANTLMAFGTLTLPGSATTVMYGGVTALECAAAHGHVQAIKILVQVRIERYCSWCEVCCHALPVLHVPSLVRLLWRSWHRVVDGFSTDPMNPCFSSLQV